MYFFASLRPKTHLPMAVQLLPAPWNAGPKSKRSFLNIFLTVLCQKCPKIFNHITCGNFSTVCYKTKKSKAQKNQATQGSCSIIEDARLLGPKILLGCRVAVWKNVLLFGVVVSSSGWMDNSIHFEPRCPMDDTFVGVTFWGCNIWAIVTRGWKMGGWNKM
jgi:hypothetical protein